LGAQLAPRNGARNIFGQEKYLYLMAIRGIALYFMPPSVIIIYELRFSGAIKCDRRWAEKQGEGLSRDWDEKFIRGFGHFARAPKIKIEIHWHSFKIQRSWKELTILLLQMF